MWWYIPSILAVLTAILLIPYLLRERSLPAAALATALGASVIAEALDLAAFIHPARIMWLKHFSLSAEMWLPAAWFGYALTFARVGKIPLLQKVILCSAFFLPVLAFFFAPENLLFSPDFAFERLVFIYPAGHFLYAAASAFLVLTLIQLERTLFALPAPHRWKVKFELMGAGAIVSILLIYNGQALLYGVIDMNLVPARGAAVVAGVSMIAFSRLRRGGKVAVRVSRQLAFRSIVLFLLGFYLIGLGLLEEGVRHFGRGFGRAAVWIVGLGGGVALIATLLSERYQRKLRVLIHKHFYKSKYDYRRQWLACTERIASARTEEELQKTILSLFCETFAVKGAVLYLKDPEGEDFFPSTFHEADPVLDPLGHDSLLVKSAGVREWVLDIRETFTGRNFPMDASFAIPLVFDQSLEGMILLGPPIDPVETYIYEDFDLMKTLARQALSTILNMRLAEQLLENREMAAAGKISAFLVHDLKNLVSSLALVIDNAERHMEDPEFRGDMLRTLGNSVQKMRRLVARLKNLEEKDSLRLEFCDLLALARENAALVQGEVHLAGEGVCVRADREELGKVVLNLLVNALEAGGSPVEVETGTDGEGAYLQVSDSGCGMSEEFVRRHLFRPFHTTKSGGFGIGLYQSRNIVEAHGGCIQVRTAPDAGTRFTVRLPLAAMETAGEGAQEVGSTTPQRSVPGLLGGTCSTCS